MVLEAVGTPGEPIDGAHDETKETRGLVASSSRIIGWTPRVSRFVEPQTAAIRRAESLPSTTGPRTARLPIPTEAGGIRPSPVYAAQGMAPVAMPIDAARAPITAKVPTTFEHALTTTN